VSRRFISGVPVVGFDCRQRLAPAFKESP
jgi:hypothetical protein